MPGELSIKADENSIASPIHSKASYDLNRHLCDAISNSVTLHNLAAANSDEQKKYAGVFGRLMDVLVDVDLRQAESSVTWTNTSLIYYERDLVAPEDAKTSLTIELARVTSRISELALTQVQYRA